jgi:pimeloyl-ACP methyl ester carboxylesterase
MSVETIRLNSGRAVALHRIAEGDGPTVVFNHAAPGSGAFDPDPVETARRGITLLAVDRPGYGNSEPLTGDEFSTVDRVADDLAEVLDGLGIRAAGLAGWSAGGRVALALAARRPDLVHRVGVVATPAPDEEVPWYPDEIRSGLEQMRGLPAGKVQAILGDQMGALLPADPRSREAFALVGAGEADAHILTRDGVVDRLGEMMSGAFRQGIGGMTTDIAGYALKPWGFEPGDVHRKTLLLYGGADQGVGSRHGRWWQAHLPDARLEMVPDAGHLLIVPMWGRVLSFLGSGRD